MPSYDAAEISLTIDDVLSIVAGQFRVVERERDELRKEVERLKQSDNWLRGQIQILGNTHPDTPVTWPYNGTTVYRELRDWSNYVLGEITE